MLEKWEKKKYKKAYDAAKNEHVDSPDQKLNKLEEQMKKIWKAK